MAIFEWREKSFPVYPKAVPPENFHITLAFLGDINESSLEQVAQMNPMKQEINLSANFVGYFAKPGIAFLGIEDDPALKTLRENVLGQLPGNIHPEQNNKFVPHITLFRGLKTPLATPLIAPKFQLAFKQLNLFESVQLNQRVSYRSVLSWPSDN